jgi:enamine deaminase RidA (YjgF/YER057c/UK114 family)
MKPAVLRFALLITVLATASAPLYSADAPAPTKAEQPSLAAPLTKKEFHRGPWENKIGYTQAIRVGNTLYVSGVTGGGPMPDAIRKSYGIIAEVLAAHGLSFQHVVKETIYTTDIEALNTHRDVRKTYYAAEFPAATWVQVSRLLNLEHVIEVEVTAVFP